MYIILFILYYNNDIIYNNKIKPQRNELRHINQLRNRSIIMHQASQKARFFLSNF